MLQPQLLVVTSVTTNVTLTPPKSVRACECAVHSAAPWSHLPRPPYNIMLAVQSQIDKASLGSPHIYYKRKKTTRELYL